MISGDDIYEIREQNKVQSKKVVVTAGGNMGLHTRAYSEMFERVFVFEPDTINFHALVRNNHADNVFFFKAALGSKALIAEIVASANCFLSV